MKSETRFRRSARLLLPLTLALGCLANQVSAGDYGKTITLIEMGDLHGTLVAHPAVLKNPDGSERQVAKAGGLAKLKTVVDSIRADNPHNLLLSCGDLTHGSAETLFTVGDAIITPMNAFNIDVFTPGNWDFGYGPAVFRGHFASKPPFPPLPANIQVMAGADGVAGVTRANFPAVAINLYNAAPLPPQFLNQRVLDPYKIIEKDSVKIAVIGITAAIVPQQADTFNVTFRFTQGIEELPGIIEEVKQQDADIIVVQSELGMSQNLEIARSFRDIDVMYSAHTHEVTTGAIIADGREVTRTTPGIPLSRKDRFRLATGSTIVVETNRDMYVGRLDLKVFGKHIVDFDWEAIPVDDSVPEDPAMAALVAAAEENFIAGDDGVVVPHTFMPGGFGGDPSLRGLQLVDDLDTVVGYTDSDTLLLRHHVLEDVLNNFIADAILAVADPVVRSSGVAGWENGVDISMANGFRFGNAVLPDSEITLRDLYTWFPIAPAVNVADYSGQSVERSLNNILGAVFDRNPFQQRGGWYLGLANMTQKIDLDHRPFTSSSGRIVETTIGGAPLDISKRYVFASCYGHGNALDEVCRTGGGANFKFLALSDPYDYASNLSLVDPVNSEQIIVGAAVKQVAPDHFLHPVHAMRRFLDSLPGKTVSQADFAVGRVETVDSTVTGNPPVSAPVPAVDPTFVQPPQGAGPEFFSGISRVLEDDD